MKYMSSHFDFGPNEVRSYSTLQAFICCALLVFKSKVSNDPAIPFLVPFSLIYLLDPDHRQKATSDNPSGIFGSLDLYLLRPSFSSFHTSNIFFHSLPSFLSKCINSILHS